MSSPKTLERIREQTAGMIRRRSSLEKTLRESRDQPVQPGDLLAASATADLAIQWAVIHRAEGVLRPLLMVPADTFPFLGPADLEVAERATGTPLILRTGYGIWVSADALEAERRCGTIEPAHVWTVWQRYQEMRDGSVPQPITADGDPEYQDWIQEVLEPARAAWDAVEPPFSKSAEETGSPDSERLLFVKRPEPRPARPWTPTGRLYALAASVLLFISLTLAGSLAYQTRRLEAALEREKGATLNSPAAGREIPHRLPMLFLSSRESERGGSGVLRLPEASPRWALVLALDPLHLYDLYRFEVVSQNTGERVWTAESLSRGESTFLSLELPRSLFPDGRYRVRLEGRNGGELPRVSEYDFELRRD